MLCSSRWSWPGGGGQSSGPGPRPTRRPSGHRTTKNGAIDRPPSTVEGNERPPLLRRPDLYLASFFFLAPFPQLLRGFYTLFGFRGPRMCWSRLIVSICEPERVSQPHQSHQPIRYRRGNSQAVWSRCTYAGAVPELLLPEGDAAALATVCPRAPR